MIKEVFTHLDIFAQAMESQSEDFLERLFDYTSEHTLKSDKQRKAYQEGVLALLANVEGLEEESEQHEAALKEALIEIDPEEFEALKAANY
ncbi:MAG TPA: hypothetical protein VK061_00100 [Bacillota bacterium]|nr:hypothetical protein [Bacillota bacterium]